MKNTNYLFLFLLVLFTACKKDDGEEAPAPFIGFTIDNPYKTQPDTISFAASSTIPSTYIWNFGDGSTEVSGQTVSHIFFDIGYYYVTLTATTDENKTATLFKGVNTSRFRRAVINSIRLSQLPASRPDGTAWDSDGTKPDLFCEISNGNRKGTTTTLNNVDLSLGGTNFNFFTAFSDSLFDQSLTIKIYNSNTSPIENDLMATVVLEKNLSELITNQEPYATSMAFQGSQVSGQLNFYWGQ